MATLEPLAGAEHGSLDDCIRAAHDDTRRLLEKAAAEPPRDDPNAPARALDSALGVLSEHLAAVEAVLGPQARRHLRHDAVSVPALLRQARAMERTMRSIAQCLGGEIHAVRRGHLADLRRQLAEELEEHVRIEERLVEALREVGAAGGEQALAARMCRLTARAPTRPHPYAPRARIPAQMVMSFNAVWDRFFDMMEGRSVPRLRPARPVPTPGRWGAYLLGIPTGAGREDTSRPARSDG